MHTSFSQRDPRWADVKLGHSYSTIGGYGCLITSVASVLADFTEAGTFGPKMDPARLNRWLARNRGFVSGNLFVFQAVEALGARLERLIECSRVAAPIDELANALARGCGVVVKVDFTPGGGLNEHWVRVLKFDGDDALIMDPWMQPGSEVIWMMPRYAHYTWGNPSRSIFRAAIYAPEGVELGSEVDTPEAFSAHVIGGAGEREEERYQQMALYRRPMGFWKKVFGR